MTGVVIAFGLAFYPHVLSQALRSSGCGGGAGALFGLGYYLLLSLGLAVAASLQDLSAVARGCACWPCAAAGFCSTVKHQLPIKR